jgi:hypothetical protein
MFSEENILSYCELCGKCEEVTKCPVKAGVYRRQITSTLIPRKAIEKIVTGSNNSLFKHIENSNFNTEGILKDWDKLKEYVFSVGQDT